MVRSALAKKLHLKVDVSVPRVKFGEYMSKEHGSLKNRIVYVWSDEVSVKQTSTEYENYDT